MTQHTSIRSSKISRTKGEPRVGTSFLGLIVKDHEGYIRKATTEALIELDTTKFRRTAARALLTWKAQRDANHNKADSRVMPKDQRQARKNLEPACTRRRDALRSWLRPGVLLYD